MTTFQMLPLFLLIGGFVLAGVISERSLKEVDESAQGTLMNTLASLRRIHIFAFPAIALATYFLHAPFWPILVGYFAVSVMLVWTKLKNSSLPRSLVRQQVISVGVILCAALLAWLWSVMV